MKKLQFEDMTELAANLCGLDAEASETEIESALFVKFNTNPEEFENLINKLFQLMDYGVSPLTSTPYVGFGTGKEWLLKKEIDVGNFISNLIQWITDGDEPTKGFVKPITEKGIVTYNLYLVKSEYKVKISKGKD